MILKFLLVLAVLVVAFVWWQHNRRTQARERAEQAQAQRQGLAQRPPTTLGAMVTCQHCGLHLPASDAVKGSLGYYCGQEHRRLAEG